MEVGLVPICVVVGGRLARHSTQQLANWHPIPYGNTGDRGAGNRSPR
jgi:hypothetical protein